MTHDDTTQLDHGTYVTFWVCPAGVHTFIRTYLGYSQYSLYIYMYTYLLVYCWWYVPRYSVLYYTIFLKIYSSQYPNYIPLYLHYIYIYFYEISNKHGSSPEEQVSKCQATADSLSTCSTRQGWTICWSIGLQYISDVLVKSGIFWIKNQHTLLIC